MSSGPLGRRPWPTVLALGLWGLLASAWTIEAASPRPAVPAASAVPATDGTLERVKRLVGPGFLVAREGPFVVAGDLPEAVFESFSKKTIRWAHDHLSTELFDAVPLNRTIAVYLFRDDASYRRNALALFGHTPSSPFGYYSDAQDALIMNISTGGGTLVHEMVHPMLDRDFPGTPAWLSEGLASLFEQCAERDGRIAGLTNWRLAGLQKALKDGRCPSLKQLVATTSREFYGVHSGLNYARARYLLYWLQERGLLHEFYRRFRGSRSSDPTGAAALMAVLGVDSWESMDRDWQRFVSGLVFVRPGGW